MDGSLLRIIDSKVDGSVIRSRSQAIEFYLRKGLRESSLESAVLLLKGEHHSLALKPFKGESLLRQQLSFFAANGIKAVYIVTQHSKKINLLLLETGNVSLKVEIIEKEAKGNADALSALQGRLKENFVAMSGDTYNNFDLLAMAKKHLSGDKLATMGLMTADKPSAYGNAILDGDLIVDFQEKPRSMSSHVVNAGIYIFKPEIFELFAGAHSLERDLFPKLAGLKQLAGFFTHGEYAHFGE